MDSGRRIVITYLLEDIAHRNFLTSVVQRIAKDSGVKPGQLEHNVESPGALKKRVSRLKRLASTAQRPRRSKPLAQDTLCDILIVAMDSNCMGLGKRRAALRKLLSGLAHPPADCVVFAIPDPHVELWYLADGRAFNAVFGKGAAPKRPQHKCGKDRYKDILARSLAEMGIRSRLGGPEYGDEIAQELDFSVLSDTDRGFKEFADDLRRAFRQVQSASE